MLVRIFIENFALIEYLDIEFGEGLQVITGETGAGKSVILGALSLILGERVAPQSAQNPEKKSIVEVTFMISEAMREEFESYDLDFDKTTLIRREILPSGKSRAFVNDVPVTLEILKKISGLLVDIHGQFDSSDLFKEEYYLEILDALSKESEPLLTKYKEHYKLYTSLLKDKGKLQQDFLEAHKESEYKNFILEELLAVDLDSIDFESLNIELSLSENVEHIARHLSVVLQKAQQPELGVLDGLAEIQSQLSKLGLLSPHFSEIGRRLEAVIVEFKDLVEVLENKAENLDLDPVRVQSLQDKYNRVNMLLLKHNCSSPDELIVLRDRLSYERNGLSYLEDSIKEHERRLSEKILLLDEIAEGLSEKRKKASLIFVNKIEACLRKLGLEKAKIELLLEKDDSFNPYGKDKVSLLFRANAGFPLKPIASAISGGERSRVMFAVKKIMAESMALPTLILDEIDAGISGKVAEEMGILMREMSSRLQLVVITHLAQIAAKGKQNYKVIKSTLSGKTKTEIVPLNDEEKKLEIARLISGTTVTSAALQQAEELMR
ncbi:MAG: DNA repair protein RecN [Bergeyella sp.]|nr:DNA repair protein RecN [Bergeyella sp.]